jgi:hypothetical protein
MQDSTGENTLPTAAAATWAGPGMVAQMTISFQYHSRSAAAITEPPYFTNPIISDRICPSAISRAR